MGITDFEFFDAHLHIINPAFPLTPNQGYVPDPYSCEQYLARLGKYTLVGGAIVAGSFQGYDQAYLIDALERLGPSYVGVAQLPADISDSEIRALHHKGVRAVRFNLVRGGAGQLETLEAVARRLHDVAGWHVELYADAADLAEIKTLLLDLPAVVIDHLGLSAAGLETLQELLAGGAYAKVTGLGRLDFTLADVLPELYEINPRRLLFGTDLPSTRAPRPYRDTDFLEVIDIVGEQGARALFSDNALDLYLGS